MLSVPSLLHRALARGAAVPAATTLLALAAIVFSACGPETTTLEATGPFAHRRASGVEVRAGDDGTSRLQITLVDADEGLLTLELAARTDVPETTCWRSPDNEHACTLGDRAGVLKKGTFSARGLVCDVGGWVERIGSAWQLDLEMAPQSLCEPGRYKATIEP